MRFPTLILFLCLCAESVRSQPTPAPLGPKETLKSWNFEEATVDKVLPWYQATTDDEKKLARSMAVQSIASTRLSKAVREKWGHDAETVITHLCLTETHEDDDAAPVVIEGDHATLTFNVPDMAPLFLIRTNGVWRVDTAAYVNALGAQLQTAVTYCDQSAVEYDKLADAVIAGKFSTAQEAIDALKKAVEPLDAK